MEKLKSAWKIGVRYFDTILALALAACFTAAGMLGYLEGPNGDKKMLSAALLVLTIFAFILIRERWARDLLKESLHKVESFVDAHDKKLEPIPPIIIGREIERSMEITDAWRYKGGCGTYLRSRTIKVNGENAIRLRHPRDIFIEIIDPLNIELCKAYSEYRTAVNRKSKDTLGNWGLKHVRIEAYATILAACYFQDQYELLDIKLALSKTMSLFRYDLSANCLLITLEDKGAPALQAMRGSFYYDEYLHELRRSFRQAKELPLEVVRGLCNQELNSKIVRDIFSKLDVLDTGFFTEAEGDTICKIIIEKAIHAKEPYTHGE